MFIRKAAALLIAAAISTSAGAFGLDSLTKLPIRRPHQRY